MAGVGPVATIGGSACYLRAHRDLSQGHHLSRYRLDPRIPNISIDHDSLCNQGRSCPAGPDRRMLAISSDETGGPHPQRAWDFTLHLET